MSETSILHQLSLFLVLILLRWVLSFYYYSLTSRSLNPLHSDFSTGLFGDLWLFCSFNTYILMPKSTGLILITNFLNFSIILHCLQLPWSSLITVIICIRCHFWHRLQCYVWWGNEQVSPESPLETHSHKVGRGCWLRASARSPPPSCAHTDWRPVGQCPRPAVIRSINALKTVRAQILRADALHMVRTLEKNFPYIITNSLFLFYLFYFFFIIMTEFILKTSLCCILGWLAWDIL